MPMRHTPNFEGGIGATGILPVPSFLLKTIHWPNNTTARR